MLYILRPSGVEFEFIGDAFIYGLMNGEILDDGQFIKTVRSIRIY